MWHFTPPFFTSPPPPVIIWLTDWPLSPSVPRVIVLQCVSALHVASHQWSSEPLPPQHPHHKHRWCFPDSDGRWRCSTTCTDVWFYCSLAPRHRPRKSDYHLYPQLSCLPATIHLFLWLIGFPAVRLHVQICVSSLNVVKLSKTFTFLYRAR